MRKAFLGVFLLPLIFSSSVISQKQSVYSDHEVINRLQANLEFLSDDVLEGRNASSHGEKVASQFIASELKKYNVKPLGDNGTYFQNFQMKVRRFVEEPTLKLKNKTGQVTADLIPGPDFIIDDSRIFDPVYMNKDADLVFVGYGITAEEYNYDDYKNIDVKDKIVIFLSGEPTGNDDEFFKGAERTNYSSGGFKMELARQNGAIGALMVLTDAAYSSWYIYTSVMMLGELKFMNEEHSAVGGMPFAMITLDGLKKIFDTEELSFEEVMKIRNEAAESKSIILNKRTGFYYNVMERIETLRNVVGIIEGNDPALKDEYVVLTAHFDHVGIYAGDVCNGANDNGSGTVAIMEIAKRFAENNTNRRSIIVALVTAEEKGLLGATYFVNNFEHIDNVVANINIDMCSMGNENSIYIIGADRTSTELAAIADQANSATVNMELDASLSYTRSFELSDHYPFVLKKIPALFLFDNYLEGLHGPNDEIQFVNFNKINKTIKLTEKMTETITNLDHRLVFDGEIQAH